MGGWNLGKRDPSRLEQASRIILEEMLHHSRVDMQREMLKELIAQEVDVEDAIGRTLDKYPVVKWSCEDIRHMLSLCKIELSYHQIRWYSKKYLEPIGAGKIEYVKDGRHKPRFWVVNGWYKEIINEDNNVD